MATKMQVSSPLSFDTATTNLIELGHPALIIISNSQDIDGTAVFQDCDVYSSSNGSKPKVEEFHDHLSAPTVTVIGKKTGHKACSSVTVTSLGKGVHLVKFGPKVSDDYSLSVCYKGEHIKGSSFTIKVVEKGALNGHWSSEKSPAVLVGEPVNLVIPEEALGSHAIEEERKLKISIRNSLGVCVYSVRHLPHLKSFAVRFTPDIESSYFINAALKATCEKSPSRMFVL